MKKLFSTALILTMCLGITSSANNQSYEKKQEAQSIHVCDGLWMLFIEQCRDEGHSGKDAISCAKLKTIECYLHYINNQQ